MKLKMIINRSREIRELAFFGLVGLSASLVHLVAAIWLIEAAQISPWLANLLGFGIAFPISLVGHSNFTFKAKNYNRAHAITTKATFRFFVLATLGAFLNEFNVLLFIEYLGYPHRVVFATSIAAVAVLLFFASKFWAFVEKP